MRLRDRILIFVGILLIIANLISDLEILLPSDETAEIDFKNSGFYLFHHILFLVAGIILIIVPVMRARRMKWKLKKELVDDFLIKEAGESDLKGSSVKE